MREIRIFFTAIMFYTRIPCPRWTDHDPTFIDASIRYFPLIGWIAGLVAGLGYYLGWVTVGPTFGVLMSMAATVLLTGAFHEDGFADVCDGFGGGWTKDKILMIMKDSRVGAYGVVGLLLLFGFKISLLFKLLNDLNDWILILLILINGHTLSRFMASTFVYTHQYVRDESTGMNKPVVKKSSVYNLAISFVLTLIPLTLLVVLVKSWFLFLLLPLTYLPKWLLARYYRKWIGGYTGDCLGAAQQVIEVSFYLFSVILWKYI